MSDQDTIEAKLVEMTTARPVRQGWRMFVCDGCGEGWEWPSRDHLSHSGEHCPECGEWEQPCGSRPDNRIPVDQFGNILIPWDSAPQP